eukprot:6924594-Pyramimonas_sp.AAC.1
MCPAQAKGWHQTERDTGKRRRAAPTITTRISKVSVATFYTPVSRSKSSNLRRQCHVSHAAYHGGRACKRTRYRTRD